MRPPVQFPSVSNVDRKIVHRKSRDYGEAARYASLFEVPTSGDLELWPINLTRGTFTPVLFFFLRFLFSS